MKEEIAKERNRQAEIKRKYELKSLDYLIGLDVELVELYEGQAKGEKLIYQLETRKSKRRGMRWQKKSLKKRYSRSRAFQYLCQSF